MMRRFQTRVQSCTARVRGWPAVEDAALNLSGIIQIHFPLVALESKSDSRALADAVINCVSAGKSSP